MTNALKTKLESLPAGALILDAGGWFKPLPFATHVADFLPYETRRDGLELGPLPAECFKKSTWIQVDFLKKDLKLPFPDRFFDFSVCTHTIEDLEYPEYLLKELGRVSKAGYIECPSRLSEQTIGIHSRCSSNTGYRHHHWIADQHEGTLDLCSKSFTAAGTGIGTKIPLSLHEHMTNSNPDAAITSLFWENHLDWRYVGKEECVRRAEDFVKGLRIPPWLHALDFVKLQARKIKYALRGNTTAKPELWWNSVLERSRPYSALDP